MLASISSFWRAASTTAAVVASIILASCGREPGSPVTTARTSPVGHPDATVAAIPKDVEARYFAKAAPFDSQVWSTQFAPAQIGDAANASPPASTARVELVLKTGALSTAKQPTGSSPGLCQDFLTNVKLYGGVTEEGCSIYPIHTDHPRRVLFPEISWATLDAAVNIDVVQGWVIDTCITRSPVSTARESSDCWNAQAAYWRRLLQERQLIVETSQIDIDGDEKFDRLYRFAIKDRGTCTTSGGRADHLWRYALRGADGDPDRARTFNALAEDGSLLLYIGGPLRNTAYFWHTTGWISYGFTLRPVDRDGRLLAATYGHTQICEFARKTPIRQKH